MNSPLKSKNNDNYNIQVVNEVSENKETSIIKKKPDNVENIIPIKFPFSFKEILNDNNKQENNEINFGNKKCISVKMIDIKNIKNQNNNNNIEFKNLVENENSENENNILTFNLINPEIINNEDKNNLNYNSNYQNDNNDNEIDINENNEFSFGNQNFNSIPEIEESEKINKKKTITNLNTSQDNSLLNLSLMNYNLPKQLKSIYDKKNITKAKNSKLKNDKLNKENLSFRNSITVSMNVNKIKNIKRGISTETYNYYSNNKSLRNSLNRGISPQEFHSKLLKTKGKESLNSSFIKPHSVKFPKLNNKEIKATYCPRIHPERIMKKWGEIHNKNWYNLSPNSRLKANEEMNQMIKDGIIK